MLTSQGQLHARSARLGCPSCIHQQPPPYRSQVPGVHGMAFRNAAVKPSQRIVAKAAEAEIDTTAQPVGAGDDVEIQDLKKGVAHIYNIRGSPTKFRRVIDKIRGRSYADALYNLTRLPYRAVEDVTEVLKSAANNAANNQGASKSDLVVSECYVDMAGHYKRFQPRAKGRPFRIQIKRSHLTVKVTEVPQGIRQKLISTLKKKKR